MKEFKRGEIYYIHFPYTFDVNYPNGRKKFVVVLQEGAIFRNWDAVTVLLVTSDSDNEGSETAVKIEQGTTKLRDTSYVLCYQPYTILKSLFDAPSVWCAGQLSPAVLDEIDAKLYNGLCMNLQNE